MGKNQDIKNGIVVRGLSKSGAFTKEDLDEHGRLTEASVSAIEGSEDFGKITKHMDTNHFKGGYAYTTAKKIQQKGGRVMLDPVKGNPHHCQIFGLPLKEANDLFSNSKTW